MIVESENGRRRIVLELFGKEFAFWVDETAVSICENIRSEAKDMLDNLELFDDEKVLEFVAYFLKTCLERIAGQELVSLLEECCEMTVPELTGVLCYAVSEIGRAFSDNEEKNNEQYY